MVSRMTRSARAGRRARRSAGEKAALVEEFRKEAIRDAALRVISRCGLGGATMQEIAEEAGVAKGTLYLYFRDRNELVEKTATEAIDRLTRRLVPVLEAPGSFESRLRALVRAEIEFFHRHRQLFRVYLSVCQPVSGALADPPPQVARYLALLADFLRRGMQSGELRSGDPDRLAMLIMDATRGVLLRRLSQAAPPPPRQEAEWIVSVLLEGVLAPGRRPRPGA